MRRTAYRGTAGEGRAAGAEATLQGVLVQVATAKRMPDARIVLTCQALGRAETLTLTLTLTWTLALTLTLTLTLALPLTR